jgi:hypothetical protein
MDFKELLEKYQLLLTENHNLKEEIKSLKAQLGIREQQVVPYEFFQHKPAPEMVEKNSSDNIMPQNINNLSNPQEKIKLFMSLFKGRDDVYAKRWENKKKGTAGYLPVCLNEWKPGLCVKPKGRCAGCNYKKYAALDEKIIEAHLSGREGLVAGIYPLLPDETCCFLAIDFDGGEWQKDIAVLREVCSEHNIPVAVERSRSGQGGHAWFFFENPIAAALARKFGSALLTYSMSKRHEITFKSYDRFFPNQDIMPKGGLGNLIALPLQKAARKNKNSEFIDGNFQPYNDQWVFLSAIQKLSEAEIEMLVSKLCHGSELGVLRKGEEDDEERPWEKNKIKLLNHDFPPDIEIVKANMLFIPKAGISQRALNQLKRLAAFQNPQFYKAQAMRMPIKKIARIISCSDETAKYLCLPRGCEADLKAVFNELNIDVSFLDKTNHGKSIDIEFNGSLRDEQPLALDKLLKHDNGILSGTTAFGKTVVAIKLIAERKVNTLILVDKVSLVSQWKKRLTEFLTINESLPETDEEKKRGRKRVQSIIGQLGAGKDTLNGIIDIAVMQSLNRMGEVKECIKNYGLIRVS